MPTEQKMPAYIGTKIIQATPMTKSDFASEPGSHVPYHGPDQEGYKVVYPDGYESWSPKEVFESAYRLVTVDERRMM